MEHAQWNLLVVVALKFVIRFHGGSYVQDYQ